MKLSHLLGLALIAAALVLAVEMQTGLRIVSDGSAKAPAYPATEVRRTSNVQSPATGQVWIDTSQQGLNVLKIYDGRDWISHGVMNVNTGMMKVEEAQIR